MFDVFPANNGIFLALEVIPDLESASEDQFVGLKVGDLDVVLSFRLISISDNFEGTGSNILIFMLAIHYSINLNNWFGIGEGDISVLVFHLFF